MDKLDLDLYTDRLARHRERLQDDVAAAQLRIQWRKLEGEMREEIPGTVLVLEALGIIPPLPQDDDESDEALIERRGTQIAAIDRALEFIETDRCCNGEDGPSMGASSYRSTFPGSSLTPDRLGG